MPCPWHDRSTTVAWSQHNRGMVAAQPRRARAAFTVPGRTAGIAVA